MSRDPMCQKGLEPRMPGASLVRPARLSFARLAVAGFGIAAALAAGGCGKPGVSGEAAAPAGHGHYETTNPSRDGIGKVYMGREISHVMGHRGAAWLERPAREREERTDLLIEALPLQAGHVVADIGAGTGYFTFPIADRVPDGRVLAVDIQPEMLALIEARKNDRGTDNVRTVLGSATDPGLAPGTVDLILIVDAYHEFSHPREMGEAMTAALRTGGRLVLSSTAARTPPYPSNRCTR